MQNCCKRIHNSILNVYENKELICSTSTRFEVSTCPKIFLTQRICKSNSNVYKIVITIFNYENSPITDLTLIHTICPLIDNYNISNLDCEKSGNAIKLDIPLIMSITIHVIVAEVTIKHPGRYSSEVKLLKTTEENKKHLLQKHLHNWVIE
jgi:hypothetical protein